MPTGVAEQFAITEATLSAWSSLDDGELRPESSPLDVLQLQGTAWGAGVGCCRAGVQACSAACVLGPQRRAPNPQP